MATWGNTAWTGDTVNQLAGYQYAHGGEFTVANQQVDLVAIRLDGTNNTGLKVRVGLYSGGNPVGRDWNDPSFPTLLEDLGEKTIVATASGWEEWASVTNPTIPVDGLWVVLTWDDANANAASMGYRTYSFPIADIDTVNTLSSNQNLVSSTAYPDPATLDLPDNAAGNSGIRVTYSDASAGTTSVFTNHLNQLNNQ